MNTNNPNLNAHKQKRASSNWRHCSKEQRPEPCRLWIKGPTLFQNTQQKKPCIVFAQPAANNGTLLVGPSTHVSSEGVIIIIVIYVTWKNRNSPLQVCPHRRKCKGPVLYLQQRSVEEISRIHNARAACPPLELNPDPTVDQSINYWWNAVSLYLILPPSWHRYRGEEGARAAKMKPCLHRYDSSSRGRCQCPLSLGRIFLLIVSVRKKKKSRKEKRVASQ